MYCTSRFHTVAGKGFIVVLEKVITGADNIINMIYTISHICKRLMGIYPSRHNTLLVIKGSQV